MQEKDTSLQSSPQLAFVEHNEGFAVALSPKQTISLYKKSKQSGIPFEILEEVYRRGFNQALELDESVDSYAFNRVNSFIAGGAAAEMDKDLMEKRGLWDNIHAKRERIKKGSGERMRKPGSKGAPTDAALKASQTEAADPCWDGYKQVGMKTKKGRQVPNCVPEEYTGAETVSADKNDPTSRFVGTDSIVNVYKNDTPGQGTSKTLSVIKKVVREQLEEECKCNGGQCQCELEEEYITERGADSKGYKRSTESGAGLTQKGVEKYRRENPGSKLSTAVTEKNPKGRRAARRRSFCARMSGVKGPMKDEKGRPTRKAMSLRRWRC